MGIAIFEGGKGSGALQWVAESDDVRQAVKDFDATIGIDPHSKGLDEVSKDLLFLRIPADQMDSWRSAEATDFPETGGLDVVTY
jgi:hypothetical protein